MANTYSQIYIQIVFAAQLTRQFQPRNPSRANLPIARQRKTIALHEPPNFHPNCNRGRDFAGRPVIEACIGRRKNELADWLFQSPVDKMELRRRA